MSRNRYGGFKSRSRWEVERERCRLDSRMPPPDDSGASDLSRLLPALMKRFGLEDEHWLMRLEEEWSEIVGGPVAAHTRPGRYDHGHLTVFVDHPVWLGELSRYGQKRMLEALRKRFPDVRIQSLRLRLADG